MSVWGITAGDGAARPATRSQQREQRNAARRRIPAEVRAVMRTFDCDSATARHIIRAARRANH